MTAPTLTTKLDRESPEAKAASQALIDSLWGSYVADVRAVRPF